MMKYQTTTLEDKFGAIDWTTEVQGLRKSNHFCKNYHLVSYAVESRTVEVMETRPTKKKDDGINKLVVK